MKITFEFPKPHGEELSESRKMSDKDFLEIAKDSIAEGFRVPEEIVKIISFERD